MGEGPTFGPPLGYVRECGPRSVAAVARLDQGRAASLLWAVRPVWMPPGGYGPRGIGIYGTPWHAIADVLVRLGHGVEWWNERGELLADARLLRGFLGYIVHDRFRAPIRRHSTRSAPSDEGQPEPVEAPAARPLSEWLDRMQAGRWVYQVETERAAHLCAWEGRLALSDDGELSEASTDWKVTTALRVLLAPAT